MPVVVAIVVDFFNRDRRLRRHVVRKVIGALLHVSVVYFPLETIFTLLVFGQRLGVTGSVPKVLRCGFVEDIDSLSVLTNMDSPCIVLLVKMMVQALVPLFL